MFRHGDVNLLSAVCSSEANRVGLWTVYYHARAVAVTYAKDANVEAAIVIHHSRACRT